ncbi:MAG: class I SAM-dependent methyltransferase [Novosphingobium sp.]|uniref:class I SAM-dependent methyltransferase n=1 Tax=Novosphingobium sp. TaxID=1874826 RepID=UPI0032B8C735
MSGCNLCGETANQAVFTVKGYHLVECTGCGLAYIANQPSDAELARIYSGSEGYHAALKDPASTQWAVITRTAQAHLAFMAQVPGKGRLLDVGCSTGQFLNLARQAGYDVSGAEFSDDSRTFAANHFGLPVEPGSIHDTSLAAASLDLITKFDVIEHVRDPLSDMAAAYRLLKPGGWFALSTPNIDGLFPRLSRPLANRLNYWPHPEPPYHLYQYSVRTLAASLTKAGFRCGPVAHRRIPLDYTFGALSTLLRSPKRAAYAALFAPTALIGPWIGQGDWFYLAAQKPA